MIRVCSLIIILTFLLGFAGYIQAGAQTEAQAEPRGKAVSELVDAVLNFDIAIYEEDEALLPAFSRYYKAVHIDEYTEAERKGEEAVNAFNTEEARAVKRAYISHLKYRQEALSLEIRYETEELRLLDKPQTEEQRTERLDNGIGQGVKLTNDVTRSIMEILNE